MQNERAFKISHFFINDLWRHFSYIQESIVDDVIDYTANSTLFFSVLFFRYLAGNQEI